MALVKTLFILAGALFLGSLYTARADRIAIKDIATAYLATSKNLYESILDTHFNPVLNVVKNSVNITDIRKRKARSVFEDVMQKLTTLFNDRLSSATDVANYAEELYKNFTHDKRLDETYSYFNANGEGGEVNESFTNGLKVNYNLSCVQTPTDVYQYAANVLNSIEWTKNIDVKMKENLNTSSKFKAWQYIGLSDGVFRTYPGSHWGKSDDLQYFDCRQRSWYIQGSTLPKDMVIVVDLSGSVLGNRLLIIKLAVISLIDTLRDDDFVNVIYFNIDAHYLKTMESHNWTHLVQATARNKKILKDAVQQDIGTGDKTANVAAGFTMAFEILEKSRSDITTTSNCTQTIAFFTDGVEGDTVADDVFSKYNSEKQIRIFTYLVGREKGSSFKAIQWIACENKGYFYRIETLSDVRQNIVKYTNVLSRSTIRKPKWTPLYLDAQGLGLLTALVVPIFNTKEGSKGEQLGVIGRDMMLDEVLSSIPPYELGAGGYAFSITNNGLIFFHPLLKKEEGVNLDYTPNIYLSEVERHFPNKDISELSKLMIDGENGITKLKEYKILTRYDNKFRIAKRKISYGYGHIINTSFSIAVAMTDYGSYYIVPKTTENGKNTELIDHKEHDIRAMENWKPDMPSQYVTKVFVGTASGLYYSEPRENGKLVNPIKQEYYERAADHWDKKTVIFSALNDQTVSASKAIVVEAHDKEAVWGVVGIHINPEKLQHILQDIDGSIKCGNYTRCYLVDEHGYIIASDYTNKTGQFFGMVEGTVMKDLVQQGGYAKYEFTDVQATCLSGYDEETSSSVRILDPLYAFANYAKWWTQTVALSFIQYSLYSILTGSNQVKAEDDESESSVYCSKAMDLYFRPDFQKAFSNDSLFYDGCSKSYASHLVNGTNLMLVIVAHDNGTYCARRNEKIKDDPRVHLEPSSEKYYRQVPMDGIGGCYPKEKESGECSSGTVVHPALVMIIFLQIILNGDIMKDPNA